MVFTPMNAATFALLCVVVIFQLSMVAEATGQDSGNCNVGGYQYAGPGIVYSGYTYSCNNNPKNRLAGQCILSLHDGVEQCNNDPNCGGFEITTNLPWHTQFDVPSLIAVQLFKKGTAADANSEWAPYLKLGGK